MSTGLTGTMTYEEAQSIQRTQRCGECGSGLLMPWAGSGYRIACLKDQTHKTTTPIRRTRVLSDGKEYNVTNQQLAVPDNSVALDVPRGSLELTKGSLEMSKQELALVGEFIHDVLKPQVHYGTVPGIAKPFLWKAGAEDLMNFFRCYPVHQQIERQFEIHTKLVLFHYQTNAVLRGTNLVMQSGQGACTNYEAKYRWRDQQRECPKCGKAAIRRGSEEYGGGWYCNARDGGCRANFKGEEAQQIDNQKVGRVENEDMLDLVNTILKMAIKRSDKDCAERFPGVASFFASPAGAEREVAESQEEAAEGGAPPASRQAQTRQPRQRASPAAPAASTPAKAREAPQSQPQAMVCALHDNIRLGKHPTLGMVHRLDDGSFCNGEAPKDAEMARLNEMAARTGARVETHLAPDDDGLPPSQTDDLAQLKDAVAEAGLEWGQFELVCLKVGWSTWLQRKGTVTEAYARLAAYANAQAGG